MDEYKKYEPIFGSWYLSRLIGKGSFGKVFEIVREEYGTTYRSALKIITIPQDDDDVKARMTEGTDLETISEYYESILKEIVNENEIMAQLKGNSNIVSYEDHQILPHDDKIGYDILIRMELLTPLIDRMVERRLDEEEVVKLGIDICKALEVCHKKNIIHRDIKPQNIFISENGDFKLGDFGIARTMEKTTGGMSKKGTFKYMAPEVYRGEPYNSTVDVYSLGIVLYALLNGNRGPFLPPPPAKVTFADEEEARARRFKGEPIPAPRDAGPMLAYIIQKACASDPWARYQTAEQMRRDLESYLDNYSSRNDYMPVDPDEKTVLDESIRGYAGSVAADQMRYTSRQNNMRNTVQQPQPYIQTREIPENKRKKTIPLIIACVVLGIAVGIGGFIAIQSIGTNGVKDLDLAGMMSEPSFSGYNGSGMITGSITADESKKQSYLAAIKNIDKRNRAAELLNSISYSPEQTEGFSNGDSINIHASYDTSIAEELGVEVTGTFRSIEVSGLEDLPDYLNGAVEHNGHYYKLVDDPMYWTQAKAACEQQNGHLATVLDADEQAFIESLVEKGGLYHYWLGACDAASEGDWRWVTGERVPLPGESGYQNWCGNQPNNIEAYEEVGQDYMELQKTRGDQGAGEYMTWTDIGDSGEASEIFFGPPDYNETKYYGYICEWDM